MVYSLSKGTVVPYCFHLVIPFPLRCLCRKAKRGIFAKGLLSELTIWKEKKIFYEQAES